MAPGALFTATSIADAYLPVVVMLLVAVGFAVGNLILSWVVGRRKPTVVKLEPYECGVPTVGTARQQVNVRFYLVALLFLLFDMETIYIITWAVAVRGNAAVAGFVPFGMAVMGIYMAILLVGLLYEWKKGALTWN